MSNPEQAELVSPDTTIPDAAEVKAARNAHLWELVYRAQNEGIDATVAMGALFEQTYLYVLQIARRLTSTRDDAQECTALTFERVIGSIGTLKNTGKPVTSWLAAVTKNVCFDYNTRGTRRRHIPVGDIEEVTNTQPHTVAASFGTPEDEAITGDVGRIVMEAVRQLPTRYRGCVALRLFHDMSGEQISRALDIHPTTVRTHQRRALGLLREILSAQHPELVASYLPKVDK